MSLDLKIMRCVVCTKVWLQKLQIYQIWVVCTFSVPCLYPVFIQRRLRTFWIQTCLKFKCDDITLAFFRWERKMENLFCVIFKKWMSLPFVGYLTKKELHILGVPPQIRTKTLANLGQNSNWFGLTNASLTQGGLSVPILQFFTSFKRFFFFTKYEFLKCFPALINAGI